MTIKQAIMGWDDHGTGDHGMGWPSNRGSWDEMTIEQANVEPDVYGTG